MSEALLKLLESAGESGLQLSSENKSLKGIVPSLKKIPALIKELKGNRLIFGPVKTKNGNIYFLPQYAPSAEKTQALIEKIVRSSSSKLLAKTSVEAKIKGVAKKYFEDALKLLVSEQKIAILKAGSGKYLLHRDALAELFPSIQTNPVPSGPLSHVPTWSEVMEVYRGIVASQGGFSSVPIGALIERLNADKESFHRLLLEQARNGKADLHTPTSPHLSAEEVSGMIKLPDKSEPFIGVTLRE